MATGALYFRAATLVALSAAGLVLGRSFTAALRGLCQIRPARRFLMQLSGDGEDRNVARAITTDQQGRYVSTALPPGVYSLTVEARGFRRHVQQEFTLAVQRQATLDVSCRWEISSRRR